MGAWAILVWVCAAVLPFSVVANDIAWTNAAGGNFLVAGNWNPNTVPNAGDTAVFDLADADPYTVTWTASVTNENYYVEQGTITWDLGGHTYYVLDGVANPPRRGFGAEGKTLDILITNGTLADDRKVYRSVQGTTTVRFSDSVTGDIGRYSAGVDSGCVVVIDGSQVTSHRWTMNDGSRLVVTNAATLNAGSQRIDMNEGGRVEITGNDSYLEGQFISMSGVLYVGQGALLVPWGTSSTLHTQIVGGRLVLDDASVQTKGWNANIYNEAGIIEGHGSIATMGSSSGSLYNQGGWIRPGGTNATGVLTHIGDAFYNSRNDVGGTIEIELGGTAAGQFDRFVVEGAFNAAGTLTVSLIDGFQPGYDVKFDILDFTSISGSFEEINLPGGETYWDLDELYTTGIIRSVRPTATVIMIR